MKEKSKPDQASLIKQYIGGSLLVILFGLSATALLFAYSFLHKERDRAQISRDQLNHYFEFYRTIMSEEMSSRNFEAIEGQVKIISDQMGGAQFRLALVNADGILVRSRDTRGGLRAPTIPDDLKRMMIDFRASEQPPPRLRFDEASGNYIYMEPLVIGESLKGFLYASIEDTYSFYRGSLATILWRTLLPALTAVLGLWILWLFGSQKYFLRPYLDGLEESKNNEHFAQTARHTAHDMREPLTSLGIYLAELKRLSEEEMNIVSGYLVHLNDIANGLLDHSRAWGATGESSKLSEEHLETLIEHVVSDKRKQFCSKKNISISFVPNGSSLGLFARISATDFRRALSNLINNSVDAMDKNKGTIDIELSEDNSKACLAVRDNGKGIPADKIQLLGKRGATFGKRNGNGLGLFFAKEAVEAWGGAMIIESEEGKGTSISLSIPKAETPAWFPTSIGVEQGTDVVVLDDKETAHNLWRSRLSEPLLAGFLGKVQHFYTEKEFLDWFNRRSKNRSCLYLFDYQLSTPSRNGLEIIDETDIYENAVIATDHFEDDELRKPCGRLGIRLIPKRMIQRIPLVPIKRGNVA